MKGRRLPDGVDVFEPGDYARLSDGAWHARTPKGPQANLANHTVTEHEDGTITVSPSILISLPRTRNGVEVGGDRVLWHGYLERGVWREC